MTGIRFQFVIKYFVKYTNLINENFLSMLFDMDSQEKNVIIHIAHIG